MFIVLSGGLQDAYTYLCRGKVFANAQTGNIVLFSAHLFEGEWALSASYLVPVLSFMAGESYLMSARPNWNTQLLPLGYLLTVAPAGIAAYLTVVAAVAGKGAGEAAGKDAAASLELKPYPMALLVAGVLSAVGVLAYTLSAGASDGAAFGLLALAVIAGGVVPCVAGALLPKKPESLLVLATVSCVCALVGAIAYRCIMWVVTVPVADLFMTVI